LFRPLAEYIAMLPIEIYRIPGTRLAWTNAAEFQRLVASEQPAQSEEQNQ